MGLGSGRKTVEEEEERGEKERTNMIDQSLPMRPINQSDYPPRGLGGAAMVFTVRVLDMLFHFWDEKGYR